MKICLTWAALAGSSLIWSPESLAQASGDLSIEVSECVELSSDPERFACYERLAEAALSERPSGEPESADATAAPAGSAPANAEHVAPPSAQDSPSPDIISTIAALDEIRPNVYTVELENGQVWRQVGSQRYPLRVGFDVRVYSTRWGHLHRLSAVDRGGFIQVERVR